MQELRRGEPRAITAIYSKPSITGNEDLADELDIHPRHASRLARRLEERELIVREVTKNNKKLIRPTAAGEVVASKLIQIKDVLDRSN